MVYTFSISGLNPEQENKLKLDLLREVSNSKFRELFRKETGIEKKELNDLLEADWYDTDEYMDNDWDDEEVENKSDEFDKNILKQFHKYSTNISLQKFFDNLSLFADKERITSIVLESLEGMDVDNISFNIIICRGAPSIQIEDEDEDEDKDEQSQHNPEDLTTSSFLVYKPELFAKKRGRPKKCK